MNLVARDRLLETGLRAAALIASALAVVILLFLCAKSLPALVSIGLRDFFLDPGWSPTHGEFNLVPMLAGSLLVTVGSILLATPIALGSALFGRFYVRGGLARIHRRVVETLAGIPSVVYGVWGLTVLVPEIARWGPPGQSLLAGVLVLALMIIPTISLIADEAIRGVAAQVVPGAAAIGLPRFTMIRRVILPAAGRGIATAVLLGTGRAIGETMAVLMVTGNVVALPDSAFAPVRTLTANIALEMAYAGEVHRAALFATGLVLALLVVAMVAMVDRLSGAESVHRNAEGVY